MADLRKFTVDVTQTVEVTLDAEKFDAAFMKEFRDSFYAFFTLVDHAEHIAQLEARSIIDLAFRKDQFVEGYGPADEMGISASCGDADTDLREQVPA